MSEYREVRCPGCNRLLFKVSGLGCIIEIVCPKCGTVSRWPVLVSEIVPKEN